MQKRSLMDSRIVENESRDSIPIEVYMVRSLYSHWSNYSGIHQFIKHIDRKKYDIHVRVVPIGDSQFPIDNEYVRSAIKRIIRVRGVGWYGINDFFAESAVFFDWLKQVPDVIHFLEGDHAVQYLPTILGKLQRYRRRPQIVATFHQPPHLLRRIIGEKIICSVDQAIVLSPVQAQFMKYYLPENRISLIPHGVDVDFWQPGYHKSDRFRCLTVGTWLRDFQTLNKVAHKLQIFPDIELQVVSRKYKNDQGLNNVFVHTGISDELLKQLYQQSHLLFLPLKDATANNSILEAVASGLPVVTTDLPSTKYYLPGDEALFIPENDPDLFVEAIYNLYSNPGLRSNMSTMSRQRALELSWEKVAESHDQLYASLASISPESRKE
jgi:glycosyltransferase involved in cell wall biosynthesis